MILDYLGGPSLITRVLESREPFPAVVRGGDVLMETGSELLPLKMEEGGSWEMKCRWLLEAAGKDKKTDPPRASRKECSPGDTLILVP